MYLCQTVCVKSFPPSLLVVQYRSVHVLCCISLVFFSSFCRICQRDIIRRNGHSHQRQGMFRIFCCLYEIVVSDISRPVGVPAQLTQLRRGLRMLLYLLICPSRDCNPLLKNLYKSIKIIAVSLLKKRFHASSV